MYNSAPWIIDGHQRLCPDSAKDFVAYEKFMEELTNVILEGRKEGARRFFIAGDLNIE